MRFTTITQVLFDGLRRRCPACRKGRMFESFFTMRTQCPVCGNRFEKSGGEVTGGMGINIVVTLLLVIVAGISVCVTPSIPLLPALLILGLGAIVFPIVFYPISRGLWAGILYLTGDSNESD